jgi:hypothetical protein
MISATDIDPSPGVPHANAAAYRRSSTQVKTPRTLAHPVPGVIAISTSLLLHTSAATLTMSSSSSMVTRAAQHRRPPRDQAAPARHVRRGSACHRPPSVTQLVDRADERQHQLGNPLRLVKLQEVSGVSDDGHVATVGQRSRRPVREIRCHATVVASV